MLWLRIKQQDVDNSGRGLHMVLGVLKKMVDALHWLSVTIWDILSAMALNMGDGFVGLGAHWHEPVLDSHSGIQKSFVYQMWAILEKKTWESGVNPN